MRQAVDPDQGRLAALKLNRCQHRPRLRPHMANVKTILISWAAAAIWLCAPARVPNAASLDHCPEGTQLTCEWDDGFCTPPMKARDRMTMVRIKPGEQGFPCHP